MLKATVQLPVHDAVQERFNYLYLKLDDVKSRAFQIGSLGLYEFDMRTVRERPDNLFTEEVETEPVQPNKAKPNIDATSPMKASMHHVSANQCKNTKTN